MKGILKLNAWWAGLLLLVIIGLAAGYRLYDIQHYPAGLFPDEAANGEDALLILTGDTRAFYPRGNGREALFFYLQAGLVNVFGIGVWPMHLASALVGIVTVTLMYFATRPYFGRLAGLMAAFLLATSYWHVTLSRTGFRAIQIPLFVAGFTAAVGYTIMLLRAKRERAAYVAAALAGVMLAGGFYTYIAYRVMVGVVVGIVGLLWLASWHRRIGFPHLKRYRWHLLVGIVAAMVTIAPLAWYFGQNPKDFVGRAGQVSVFNRELQQEYGGGTLPGTIWYSTRETVRSFFVGEGDTNWRHNVAGYPLLNPLTGLLFLLGLAWAVRGLFIVGKKIWQGEELHLIMVYPYILLLLLGMLLPVITTAEGIPHGLRSVGLIAPIFMLAGAAGAVALRWLWRLVPHQGAQSVVTGLLGGLFLAGAVYDGGLYFLVSRNDSGAAYAYRADLTEVAEYILERHRSGSRPYLALDGFSVQTVHFLTHEKVDGQWMPPPHDFQSHPEAEQHRYRVLKPEEAELTALLPGEEIIFTQSTLPDADRYAATYGDAIEMVESRVNRWGQEYMRVYQAVEEPPAEAAPNLFDLDA